MSPFVGRITDWFKSAEKKDAAFTYPPDEDPGVRFVRDVYATYKKLGYATQVMGASFRTPEQVVALAHEARAPVLFHAGRGIPHLGEAVVDLARSYPGARLILAHAGISDLGWIADDGRRRGDDDPVLVAHSTSEFAAEHLDAPQEAAPLLALAVRDALGLSTEPESTHVHRWTFAKPTGQREATHFLGDALVGLCSDAWSTKPRVESAYLSGLELGQAVAARLAP